MDSASILDICTCGICLETFDESSKCPRVLSCGHSYCYSCLGRLLALNPCCPTCRAEILFQSTESIPINYSLKSLINFRSQILMPNTSSNPVDLSPRHLPQTREAVGTLCQNRSVYAVEDRYDGTRYGKLALKDGRILVNSLQPEKPEVATLFALPELLSRFNNGSSELPKTVFLRVTPLFPGGRRGDSFEVIIETDGLTPRAKNSILLCSALKGPSYKGLTMWCYTTYYEIISAPHIVEGIRRDDPGTPLKEGGVYGRFNGDSRFFIQLKDEQPYHIPKFGVVVAGLQRLKDLQGRRCTIEECGLVI